MTAPLEARLLEKTNPISRLDKEARGERGGPVLAQVICASLENCKTKPMSRSRRFSPVRMRTRPFPAAAQSSEKTNPISRPGEENKHVASRRIRPDPSFFYVTGNLQNKANQRVAAVLARRMRTRAFRAAAHPPKKRTQFRDPPAEQGAIGRLLAADSRA